MKQTYYIIGVLVFGVFLLAMLVVGYTGFQMGTYKAESAIYKHRMSEDMRILVTHMVVEEMQAISIGEEVNMASSEP